MSTFTKTEQLLQKISSLKTDTRPAIDGLNELRNLIMTFNDSNTDVILNGENGYMLLAEVLSEAFKQASEGKGKERHAQNLNFENQPMQTISNLLGTQDGMFYQAIKKIQESQRLPTKERKVNELYGAIIYIAGAIININGKA